MRLAQKWLTLLLVLALVTTQLPIPAFAVSHDNVIDLSDENPDASGNGWSYSVNVYIITASVPDPDVIIIGNNAGSNRRIEVAAGVKANISLDGVSISGLNMNESPILIKSGAEVTIKLTNRTMPNILIAGANCAGLQLETGSELTIEGPGSLEVTGGIGGAGIGGGLSKDTGKIFIEGGTIVAIGGSASSAAGAGAGIGGGGGDGGGGGFGQNITINGGYIKAYGGDGAYDKGGGAGIGGGGGDSAAGGNSGIIFINGGDIEVFGGYGNDNGGGGAGIGGGGGGSTAKGGDGAEITITNGNIISIGGDGNSGAAGIGGGGGGSNGDGGISEVIKINNGTTEAIGGGGNNSGGGAAGIGGGGGGGGSAGGNGGDAKVIEITPPALITAIGGDGGDSTSADAKAGGGGAGIGGGGAGKNGVAGNVALTDITMSLGIIAIKGGEGGKNSDGESSGCFGANIGNGGKADSNGTSLYHTITTKYNEGGRINPFFNFVKLDSTGDAAKKIFTITADTGYYIKTIKLDGTDVDFGTDNEEFELTISNIKENHFIEATFAATIFLNFDIQPANTQTYPNDIILIADIHPSDNSISKEGRTIIFTIVDDKGISFSTVIADTNVDGIALYTLKGVPVGTYIIKALYAGDEDDFIDPAASDPVTYTVAKGTQTPLTLNNLAGNYTYGAAAFTVSASGGSGSGAVTYTSSDSAVASVANGVPGADQATVTIHSAGTFAITAIKAADNNYLAASATSGAITVSPRDINNVNADITGSRVYSGASLNPGIIVSDGAIPITGSDYDIVYGVNNINAGIGAGSATLIGKNNYSGTKAISFDIEKAVVDIAAIGGLTAPVRGNAPVFEITATAQYTGTVTWAPAVYSAFEAGTVYTSTITLIPTDNYTLNGVSAGFFSVTGAASVENNADSGVITAVFPSTSASNSHTGGVGGGAIEPPTPAPSPPPSPPTTDTPGGDGGQTVDLGEGISFETPKGQNAIRNDDGSYTLPGGGIITTANGLKIYVPAGTVIDKDGKIIFPIGSGRGRISYARGISFNILPNVAIFLEPDDLVWYSVTINNPFADVKESDWFYSDVMFAYTHGVMLGTDIDRMLFSPNTPITRGMLVTILYRMTENPDAGGFANPFSDVANDDWYTDAVIWAASNEIVKGYGDGLYGPDDSVTRQDLAVILTRYMNYMKINLAVTEQWIIFADETDISGYAMDAIQTLFKLGIINGTGTNQTDQTIINPGGIAIRAELAAMLNRLIKNIGYLS